MKKKATAILSADWHITEEQPVCRLDNYPEAQKNKLIEIIELQKEHNCPILTAGDVFDSWKPSTVNHGYGMLSQVMDYFPNGVIAIPGQHDLPNHNLDLYDKSPLAVMEKAKGSQMRVLHLKPPIDFHLMEKFIVHGFPYGASSYTGPKHDRPLVALIHTLVTPSVDSAKGLLLHKSAQSEPQVEQTLKNPVPGALTAFDIFQKFSNFDLIVSGDNHIPFVCQYGKQLLVNPGSLMRMTASQIDHKPRVYLWFAESNTVEPIYLSIAKGVVSRDHLTKKEEKTNETKAFVNILKGGFDLELSFKENIKNYLHENKVTREIENKVWNMVEGSPSLCE